MFLHLGGEVVVHKKDIIAIFDLRTRKSAITGEFLKNVQEDGAVEYISDGDKAKSFVVTDDRVYFSPIACATLRKRCMA